jgi:hypothetical protein
VNGLGSLKHRKQVRNLFEDIKNTLAECVLDCACQMPLNQADTLLIVTFLKNNCQQINSHAITGSLIANRSTIEPSQLYLIMALLYTFDCSYLENKEKGGWFFMYNYLRIIYISFIDAILKLKWRKLWKII